MEVDRAAQALIDAKAMGDDQRVAELEQELTKLLAVDASHLAAGHIWEYLSSTVIMVRRWAGWCFVQFTITAKAGHNHLSF